MFQIYVGFNLAHPLVAAFGQFLLLGTAGEVLSVKIRSGQHGFPFTRNKILLKALGWGLLGIYIKFMFVTASAGIQGLIAYGVLPKALAQPSDSWALFGSALATSVLMNIMLGPSMMLIHRLADNAIDFFLDDPAIGWAGIQKAMATLVWLWIPLHTFTFAQPKEIRIGVAAVLSMVLGIVMGLAARKSPAQPMARASARPRHRL